ncbi:MAG: DUF1559 domain-containing protein [Planctomycetaceae bacterium]
MPIVQCPGCGKKLNLKEPQPGKRLRCPGCGEGFVPVPAGRSGAAPKRKRPAPVDDFGDDFGDEDYGDDNFGAPAAPKRSGAKAGGKKKKKSGGAKKSKLPLFLGVGVLGIALAGGLIYMLMSGGEQAAETDVADGNGAAADGAAADGAAADGADGMAALDDPAAMPEGDAAAGGADIAGGDSISLKWLPGDSEVVVFIDVEKLLAGPLGQLVQNPLLQPQIQEMQQKSGLAPSDIRSVTIGIGGISESAASGQPPKPEEQPVLAVVRVKATLDLAKLQTVIPGAQLVGTSGAQQLQIPETPPVTLWLADPTTMVIGRDKVLETAKSSSSVPTGIDPSLLKSGSGIHVAFMPSDAEQVFRKNVPRPDSPDPTKQPLIDFLNVVQPTMMALSLDVDFDDDINIAGAIKTNGSSGARNTTAALQKLLDSVKQMQKSTPEGQVPGIILMAMNADKAVLDSFKVQTQGDSSQFSMTAPGAGQQIAAFAPMMLPAIMQARTAARRTMSQNHLKQIAMALHNFHATYNRFPNAAGMSPSGEKWLSWRVHLLPFLEQQELYAKFALEEPWDSPTNRPLADQMPEVYQSATATLETGRTLIQLPVGPGTLFEDSTGRALRDITDGSSNTILAVEVAPDRAVYWTQPDDLVFNPDSPADGLGGVEPGGFQAVLADGSVRLISTDLSSAMLKALFTRNGGEVVSGAF